MNDCWLVGSSGVVLEPNNSRKLHSHYILVEMPNIFVLKIIIIKIIIIIIIINSINVLSLHS